MLIAFGEIMIRLSPPGRQLLLQTPRLDCWTAGAEANVVTALARLGHRCGFISAVPASPIGDAAISSLRSHGVDCSHVRRAPGRMGLYWVESGAGLRPTRVIYDRDHSAFAEVPPEEWDWDQLIEGADRLHLSGITPALGPNGTAAALSAAAAAGRLGVPVSFDGNYRSLLWERWTGRPHETLGRLVEQANILFADHRDIGLVLGRTFSGDVSGARAQAARAAFDAFPRLRLIASTIRQAEHVDCHRLSARVASRGDQHETDEIEVPGIVDRVGTGDAFAAGVLHAERNGGTISQMARTGLAMAALKHSVPGDATPVRMADLEAILSGDFAVRR